QVEHRLFHRADPGHDHRAAALGPEAVVIEFVPDGLGPEGADPAGQVTRDDVLDHSRCRGRAGAIGDRGLAEAERAVLGLQLRAHRADAAVVDEVNAGLDDLHGRLAQMARPMRAASRMAAWMSRDDTASSMRNS